MNHEDRIRVRAYDIWIAEGCPAGRREELWQRAAAEIDALIPDGLGNTNVNPGAEVEEPTLIGDATSETKPSRVRRVA
jgi:Protein of unknown function (DUF2934)